MIMIVKAQLSLHDMWVSRTLPTASTFCNVIVSSAQRTLEQATALVAYCIQLSSLARTLNRHEFA